MQNKTKMSIEEFTFNPLHIVKSYKRSRTNCLVSDYYKELDSKYKDYVCDNDGEIHYYVDTGPTDFLRHSFRVQNCFQLWNIETYRQQHVKDIKSISLCGDKFCKNCQNELSKRRYEKYHTVLDDLAKNHYLYHVIFTVPNVPGVEIKHTVKFMSDRFAYLMDYFNGHKHCNGLDFPSGYLGAVRSLEITTSDGAYHPHYHCIFVFDRKVPDKGVNLNQFSFDRYSTKKYIFSDFEITLQKLWYLIYNSQRVTLSAINELNLGYSVRMQDCRHTKIGYKEVFKYAIGGMFKKDGNPDFDITVFENLFLSLFNRRCIQGYGILNKFKFEDDSFSKEDVELAYLELKTELNRVEEPVQEVQLLKDLKKEVSSTASYRYISRKTFKSYLEDLANNNYIVPTKKDS